MVVLDRPCRVHPNFQPRLYQNYSALLECQCVHYVVVRKSVRKGFDYQSEGNTGGRNRIAKLL